MPRPFEPSPEQQRAIRAPMGPVLVIAGPGAGKTFCLIGRVESLIRDHDLSPERICAVTFTNKAAEEIAVRLDRTLGPSGDDVVRGTMHALCLGFLREYGTRVGLRPGFGVADDDYQRSVLRRMHVPRKRMGYVLVQFGRRRLQGFRLETADERLYQEYIDTLRTKNMLDFDDLISQTLRLFSEHPDVTAEFAGRWDYILVDEFQDLNESQYAVVKLLAEPHRCLFAVGDDEQSIFSWAGSDPRVLMRFREDFGLGPPIVLDQNRRCSRQIFDAARRLLAANPVLFEKRIEARREGEFDVEAHEFPSEHEETTWLLEHLTTSRADGDGGWGAYALLYRKHQVGTELEKALVRAGIPCRLNRGHSLMDDPVVAYTVASLRVMIAPDDPNALDAFANRMLPRHLLEHVQATANEEDLVTAFRNYARQHTRTDPDTKKAWRFVFHVENLKALWQSHDRLSTLVDDLLAQRVGRYRNPLEERADDLTDPLAYAGARELAEKLQLAIKNHGVLRVGRVPGGMDFAVRGMLRRANVPALSPSEDQITDGIDEAVLTPEELNDDVFPVRLFKALQLMQGFDQSNPFRDYVTFDLETTDRETDRCEIIEIGAARVRDGKVTDTFRSLVRCSRPISAGARKVHGYQDSDLVDAPHFRNVWPAFREFIGSDILIAHNAHDFDVPVLKRSVATVTDEEATQDLVFYDSLPLARSLFQESARLEDLATRLGVEKDQSHHALDDAVTLANVFVHLNQRRIIRARKASLVHVLDYLGLALALSDGDQPSTAEARVLLDIARIYTLGRYSDCLEAYTAAQEDGFVDRDRSVDEVVQRLGGRHLMDRIRIEKSAAERYPAAIALIHALLESSGGDSLEPSARAFLERVALSTSEGVETSPHRVNLLTLHSTKGLEFDHVYVVGVEDYQLPGYYAAVDNREDEIQEARRLLYVGMTRARHRLVLTRCQNRFGQPSGGRRFLDEIGVEVKTPGGPVFSSQ